MQPSQQIIDFIKSYEKCVLAPYQDQAGLWTIGWGHLIGPQEDYPDGLSQPAADAMFLNDLDTKAVNPVLGAIQVSVSQQEFDACVSLCYNIGAGNFRSSSLLRLLNAGQPAAIIVKHFMLWDKVSTPDGLTVSDGLLARRRAEADIFLNGNYVNHS